MNLLSKAIMLATKAHDGQKDKGGNPYILHPLRLMINLKTDVERIVAVLHDVVEDTEITLQDLKNEGFSVEILNALDCLTRRNGESYEDFITRCKCDPISRAVKLQDLDDNCNLDRIKNPTQKDYDRVEKYNKAKHQLIHD